MTPVVKAARVQTQDGDHTVAQNVWLTLQFPLDTTLKEFEAGVKRMSHIERRFQECDRINSTSLSVDVEHKGQARCVNGHVVLWLHEYDGLWTADDHRSFFEQIASILMEYGYDISGR